MKIEIIEETGFKQALFGIGLSYGFTSNITYNSFTRNGSIMQKMYDVSLKLYNKDGGHNKFLETCGIILDITAPRYWWQEADTYRVGSSKQSESTIHTVLKNPFTQEMFEEPVSAECLRELNELRVCRVFGGLKTCFQRDFCSAEFGC